MWSFKKNATKEPTELQFSEIELRQRQCKTEVLQKVNDLNLPITPTTDFRVANFVVIGHLLERIEALEKEVRELKLGSGTVLNGKIIQ